jgi:hypothetical protein
MPPALIDSVSIRGRFHRSVHLASDWETGGVLGDYLLTPTISELAQFILRELGSQNGLRAWSITGPYGSGKSAFALFLADCLCSSKRNSAAKDLVKKAKFEDGLFQPVLLTAERAPLGPQLQRALESLTSGRTNRSRRAGRTRTHSGEQLAEMLLRTARSVRRRRKAGLFVVVDELGKFLEYAALHPDEADVFVLQPLAEAAARSEVPVLFLTILHSGFADYLPPEEEVRRSEWQKVQGRFHDVPFQLPAEQVLELMGNAIQGPTRGRLVSAWSSEYERVRGAEAMSEALQRLPNPNLLKGCFPLDPLTALLLWPVFRSKGAQNERSLFAFLSSEEPLGFTDFLKSASDSSGRVELFRIPRLYDYLATSLGLGAFRGEHARRWSLIDEALARLPVDAPPGAADVLKTIGLLSTYGASVGIRASAEVVDLAVGDHATPTAAREYLLERSYLIYRRQLDAYALWEGSDFDLEVARQEAGEKVQRAGSVAQRLDRVFELRPVVPRAHYIKTGTFRYFEPILAGGRATEIEVALNQETQADGRLVFVLPERGTDVADVVERCRGYRGESDVATAFAVAQRATDLEAQLHDFEAWKWISENRLELASDAVARKEVRSRLLDARQRLAAVAGPTLGLPGYRFQPEACSWIHDGQEERIESPVALQRWLSRVFEDTYSSAPGLHNELLNRQTLSSAASAARRNLIERMLTNGHEERLGIEGYPPEASMYESMLRAGGLHVEGKYGWKFRRASGTWRPAWDTIQAFLDEAQTMKRPLRDLIDLLKRPPVGLRDGPLPVLLTAVLLCKGDRVSLYEDGVFVPELRIETLERLIKRPETFEIRCHRLSPAQARALAAVNTVLATQLPDTSDEDPAEHATLVGAVRSLVMFAGKLPPYVRQTRRLGGEHAAAIRDQLLNATDPAELLFRDLPIACGIERLTKAQAPAFIERLGLGIRELGRAYQALLDELEKQIVSAFGLPGAEGAARLQLRQRAAVLVDIVVDPRIVVFVKEAARIAETPKWIERLGRALNQGIPPAHWHDRDVTKFQIRLREVASEFERLEELAAEQRRSGAPRVLRFGLLDASGPEMRRVIPIRTEQDGEVQELVARLSDALGTRREGSEDELRIQLEALGRVAVSLMASEAKEEVSS